MATDSDAKDKGLVAGRPGFWRGTGATESRRVDACRQSERENKVCDLRSSWFVTVISSPSGRTFRLDRTHYPFTSGAASRVIDDDDGMR